MKYFYSIAISLYRLSIFTASFFNTKAKLWVEGRRNIFGRIEEQLTLKPLNSGTGPIWFHCASLGEFEQGRPLIEKLKSQSLKVKVLITFFSPSGYEIRKNYPLADYVFYLPADSGPNAQKFISAFNPSAAIFVKYEFWFYYLNELHKRRIPSFLISAAFRENQHFFKWYGGFFRKMLGMFSHIFVQNETSKSLLEKAGISQVSVSGDTRFDRVFETSQAVEEIPLVSRFRGKKKVLIAGSTWAEDEKIIAGCRIQKSDLKLIIAPHEIHEKHIESVIDLFPNSNILRFSQASEKNIEEADILVIDNIGMLARLYRYGHIAYVGGAFGRSLHNILEPAAFGLPVLFGPDHQKFPEAAALIEKGGAFSIKDSAELESRINFLLQDEMVLNIASEMSRFFVRYNTGATVKIMEEIKKATAKS